MDKEKAELVVILTGVVERLENVRYSRVASGNIMQMAKYHSAINSTLKAIESLTS